MSHITIKTPAEIGMMQAAGRIVEEVLLTIQGLVQPNVTTKSLDEAAVAIIKKHCAKASFLGYMGAGSTRFPASICASVNEEVVHGFPGKRKLLNGDIISIDVGVELNGWHADAARTFLVGEVSQEVQKLVRVTRDSFFAGLQMARPGNRIGDISEAVQNCAEAHGYGVVRVLIGHGIGRRLHEPPDVPNYILPGRGRGVRLVPGMTIAVEPMINMGTHEVRTLEDHWTVVTKDKKPSAHYENTIAITEGEPVMLTRSEQAYDPEVLNAGD